MIETENKNYIEKLKSGLTDCDKSPHTTEPDRLGFYREIQIIDGTVQDCDNLSCFGENPSYFSKLLYNVQ